MSALVNCLSTIGMAVLLLLGAACCGSEGLKTDEGPGASIDGIEDPAVPGPSSIHRTRGDLILVDGENLTISQDMTFRKGYLGPGSILYLVNCTVELIGDGNEEPSLTGSPSGLFMFNSTLKLTGWNGTSRLSNKGSNATIDLDLEKELKMIDSEIRLRGGRGWSPVQPGARFDVDLTGYEFSGGNCTIDIRSGPDSIMGFHSSRIFLEGGDGGDAPDGESMSSNNFYPSGGYTTGANVSGWVGAGGGKKMRISSSLGSVLFDSTEVHMTNGYGGDAGDAGDVVWSGQDTYTRPTSSGGYTSGGWSGGEPYDPGTASGNVGRGGSSVLDISCLDLHVEDSKFNLNGGFAGRSGEGGSCISPEQGSPSSVTNTLGGGGGAGFAGGYGGYSSLVSYGGGIGGDVLDNVGSGGDSVLNINCSLGVWFDSLDILNYGGWVWSMSEGGSGGGSTVHSLDGGGGGAGGMSGGGGAPAKMLVNDLEGGANGTVSGHAAWGGGAHVSISSRYFMSRDRTDILSIGGQCFDSTGVSGKHGEVGGSDAYEGGPGGTGHDFGSRIGPSSMEVLLPAPFPVSPVNGDIITDLSEPFQWSSLDPGLYSGTGQTIRFRVLGSLNISDVVQERDCTGSSTTLLHDLDDGNYYWTVMVEQGSLGSTWMYPQMFMIDREYPVLVSGIERTWFSMDDCSPRVRFMENTSGLDPDSVQCRSGPPGGPYSNWYDVEMEDLGGGLYEIIAELEPVEMNYSFWVRASDNAGNGPVLAGPFIVGIDGTPPVIADLSPSQWTGSSFHMEFKAVDGSSGLTDEMWLEITGSGYHDNISMVVEQLEEGLFRTKEKMMMEEGNYTMELSVRDNAGNVGSSGEVLLLVDDSIPHLAGYYPVDGAVLKDPFPTPSVKIIDSLSGPKSLDYHLSGPSGEFDLRYGDLDASVDVTIGQPLSEGIYTWSITTEDAAGNRLFAGPFTFIIDLTGPESEIDSVVRSSASIDVTFHDTLTGISSAEIECLLPSADGLEVLWTDQYQLEPSGPPGTDTLKISGDVPSPAAYFRARGTDIAGNQGPWSDLFRSDQHEGSEVLELEMAEAIKPDDDLAVRVGSDIGMDTGSLELIIEDEGGAFSILGPSDVNVLLNKTPYETSDVKVPSLVEAVFDIPYDTGRIRASVRAKDPFPLSGAWISSEAVLIIDPAPPVIEMEHRRFYKERKVQVPMTILEEDSAVSSVMISVNGEPFRVLDDKEGSPSMVVGNSNERLLVLELEWGEEVDITVRVEDLAGHLSTYSFETRATRAPAVSLRKSIEGPVVEGSPFTVTAEGSDPDGEDLRYNWFIDGEPAGNGTSVEPVLDAGKHTISVNCTDGFLFAETQLEVVVQERLSSSSEDGRGMSGAAVFLIVLFILISIVAVGGGLYLLKRRKSEDDEDPTMEWDDDEENISMSSGSSRKGEDGTQCSICLRPLRNSSNMMKCRCGARFHRGCAAKEGECPDCGRELMLRKDL